MTETDKQWLVKTSGRLLGPFSFEEVMEEIRLKRFSIIDEVRSSKTRWGFIREHIDFREMVKQIRESQEYIKDDTMATSTMAVDTRSDTKSDNKTVTDFSEITHTPVPTPVAKVIPIVIPGISPESKGFSNVDTQKPSSKKDQVIDNSTRDVTFSPTKKNSFLNTKTGAYGHSSATKTKSNSTSGAIIVAAVTALAVGFIVFQKKFSKSSGNKATVVQAQNYFAKGMYEKAYGIYRSSSDTTDLNSQDQFRFAVTSMFVPGQNAQSRRLLESLKGKKDLNNESELENLIGITFAKEGQWSEAKNHYQQSIKLDAQNKMAKINSVFSTFNLGNDIQALAELDQLEMSGVSENYLSVFKSFLIGKKYETNARYVQKTLEELGRWQGRTRWFRPEMTFMQSYLLFKNGRLSEAKSFAEQLLNDDPDISSQFLYDYGIDLQSINWELFRPMCEDLSKGFQNTALSDAILSYCHYQRKELSTAFDIIEKARNQFSKEKSIIPWHIFLLSKSERNDEAKTLVKIADSVNNPLVALVEARICEGNSDWECAETAWKKLLVKDPTSPQAMIGLAFKYLQQKDLNTAKSYLSKTQIVANRYRPLLELKEKMNVEP